MRIAILSLALGAASVVLPRDWVTGVRLEFDRSGSAGILRLVTAAISMPIAFVLLIAGSFSPFLYFQF